MFFIATYIHELIEKKEKEKPGTYPNIESTHAPTPTSHCTIESKIYINTVDNYGLPKIKHDQSTF